MYCKCISLKKLLIFQNNKSQRQQIHLPTPNKVDQFYFEHKGNGFSNQVFNKI